MEVEAAEARSPAPGYKRSGRRYKCLSCTKTFPNAPRAARHAATHGPADCSEEVAEVPHRRAPLPLLRVREELLPLILAHMPPAHPRGTEALPLPGLRQGLHAAQFLPE
ncbi:ZNF668 isoform 7, partial [Pongo abelii]